MPPLREETPARALHWNNVSCYTLLYGRHTHTHSSACTVIRIHSRLKPTADIEDFEFQLGGGCDLNLISIHLHCRGIKFYDGHRPNREQIFLLGCPNRQVATPNETLVSPKD
jgi:hypothetical protein